MYNKGVLTYQKGEPIDLQVISVILASPQVEHQFNIFHCNLCGNKMFQYSGTILMILPGETKTTIPVVVKCHGCKTRYLLNSII